MNPFSIIIKRFSRLFRQIDATRLCAGFLVFLLGVVEPASVFAQNTPVIPGGIFLPPDQLEIQERPAYAPVDSYSDLIAEFIALQDGHDQFGALQRSDRDERRAKLLARYQKYLAFERERLATSGVHPGKQKLILDLLEEQMRSLGGTLTLFDKVRSFVEEKIFGKDPNQISTVLDAPEKAAVLPILKNPSSFSALDDTFAVKSAGNLVGIPQQGESIPKEIKNILKLEEVQAGADAPTVADTSQDGGEVRINDEIRSLALSLNNNPVEIFNYLSSSIRYVPYAGAVKGSIGCLKDKACNDTDSTSLALALLRASGIPSRYVKSLAIFTKQQMLDLVGVDDIRSAAVLLGAGENGYRFGLNETNADGSTKPLEGNLKDLDLSRVTSVAVEWVYPELFIDYDERGANFPNTFNSKEFKTDDELAAALSKFPAKQWLPFDVIVKPHRRTKVDIVPDAAHLDAEQFWQDTLSAPSSKSPVQAYADVIREKTGKSIFDASSRSTITVAKRTVPVLPPATPFVLAQGSIGGAAINRETWSTLPDDRRVALTISLHKSGDATTILSQQRFASQIDNVPLTLSYEGATDADKSLIIQSDGIANTPPALLTVVPVLSVGEAKTVGSIGIGVGSSLILRFTVTRGSVQIVQNEKYSTAGNVEGIYAVFLAVQDDPAASTPDQIMIAGPAAIGREYLSKTLSDAAIVAESLDYRYVPFFARTVVTDNRTIKQQAGSPISFEFSGLTIDACLLIAGASGRGVSTDHRKEFHLIGAGLNPSYYESQIFTDLAGLDGISTVTGLQYARSKPSEYTVKTITSQNATEIDSLDLPSAVRQQMSDAVASGGTVVTPTKAVMKDAWSGVLYIARRPDFTATYAIGEQVTGNGGRSTDAFRKASWKDESSGQTKRSHQTTKDRPKKGGGVQRVEFIKKEDASRNIICTISDTTFQSIVSGSDTSGWSQTKYGVPCYEERLSFGENDHRFIVATDGAYFKSAKRRYEYWIKNDEIQSSFFPRIPRVPQMASLYPYWGTYAYLNEEVKDFNKPAEFRSLVMYSPQDKKTYAIEGSMGEKYIGSEKVLDAYVPGLLGYPTSAAAKTAESSFEINGAVWGSNGRYQQFANGTLYSRKNWWPVPDDVHPVIGKINEEHTARGGSVGVGLPSMDPEFLGDTKNEIFQTFESGLKFSHSLGSDSVAVTDATQTISFNRAFGDNELPDFVEGLQDGLLDLGIAAAIGAGVGLTMGVALKILPEKISKAFGAKAAALLGAKFVPFIGWAFAGATVSLAAYNAGPLYDSCKMDVDARPEGKAPAYFCGLLLVSVTADMAGAKNPFKHAVKGALNKLGVKDSVARAGKTKLIKAFEQYTDSQSAKEAAGLLGGLNFDQRTTLAKLLDQKYIVDDDLAYLAKNPRVFQKAISSEGQAARQMILRDFVGEGYYTQKQLDAVEAMHEWIVTELRKDTNTAVFAKYGSKMREAYWKKAAEHPNAKNLFVDFEKEGVQENLAKNGSPAPSFKFSPNQSIQLHHLRPKDSKLFPDLQGDWDNILPLPRDIHTNTFKIGGVTYERFQGIAKPILPID